MKLSSEANQSNSEAVSIIVQYLKAQGIFDQFRRECLEDVDTKPSFSNLRQRLEGYVNRFLTQQEWSPSLNKNQLRERLRKQINESGMVKYNVDHLVDQVVATRASAYVYSRIERVVKEYLGLNEGEEEKKKDNNHSDSRWTGDANMDKDEPKSSNDIKKEECHNPPSLSPSLVSSESLSTPSPSSCSNHSNHSPSLSSFQPDENVSKSRFKSTFTEVPLSTSDEKSINLFDASPHLGQKLISIKSEPHSPDSNSSTNVSSQSSVSSNLKKASHKTSYLTSTKPSFFQQSAHPTTSLQKALSPKEQTSPRSSPQSQSRPTSSKTSMPITVQESSNLEPDRSKIESEYLSDVSSVHTSDLSDFDDRISISSDEEKEGLKKKKVSLKELKKIIQSEMKLKEKSEPESRSFSRNDKKTKKK